MTLLRPAFPRLQRGHPLARGLVGAWELTEGSGLSAYDSSGYGNHGTLLNNPTWVGGPAGSALNFVGGSVQSVSAPIPAQFNNATQATICGWIYKSAAGNHIEFGADTDGVNRISIIWPSDSNIYFSASAGLGEYGYVALSGTGFHHCCLVFNGALSGNARMSGYIDGVPRTLTYSETPPAALSTNAAMGDFLIGKSSAGGSTGIAYSVRAYSMALSAQDISMMYATDSQGLFRPSSAEFLSVLSGAQIPWPPLGSGPALHVVSTPMRW